MQRLENRLKCTVHIPVLLCKIKTALCQNKVKARKEATRNQRLACFLYHIHYDLPWLVSCGAEQLGKYVDSLKGNKKYSK